MCRMLLTVGNITTYPLLESMKLISNDQTQQHEWHQVYPQGTYLHHDGWGAATYDNDAWQLSQSILPFPQDQSIKNVPSTPSILLLHLRRKSIGNTSPQNTHPFHITHNQKQFFFAHNGQIAHQITYHPKFVAQGTTDSEQLLYAICSEESFETNPLQSIATTLLKYQSSHGTNVILSSHDQSIIGLAPSQYQKYFTMYMAVTPDQTIICSEPLPLLSHLVWQEIKPGSICLLDHKTREITTRSIENISPICQKV